MASLSWLLACTGSAAALASNVLYANTTAAVVLPTCMASDYDCMTDYYSAQHTCQSSDIDCMVSALPTSACVSGNSTSLNCAVSLYHPCTSDEYNCMASAYAEKFTMTPNSTTAAELGTAYHSAAHAAPGSAVGRPATHAAPASSAGRSGSDTAPESSIARSASDAAPASSIGRSARQTTVRTDGLADGMTTLDLFTVTPSTMSTSVHSSAVSRTSSKAAKPQQSPPPQTRCTPGDQSCYARHPTHPNGPTNGADHDISDVSGSNIDDEGRIKGVDTPLVALRHNEANDKNSDKCYRALVYNDKFHKFDIKHCVIALHPEAATDPTDTRQGAIGMHVVRHKGHFWYDSKAAAYAESKGRHPRCIDFRVDTGCGFSRIGNQKRCREKFHLQGEMLPYRPVDCSAFGIPH